MDTRIIKVLKNPIINRAQVARFLYPALKLSTAKSNLNRQVNGTQVISTEDEERLRVLLRALLQDLTPAARTPRTLKQS